MKVHIKVNTGMNRYGFSIEELPALCIALKKEPKIFVQGVYSHLYTHQKEICLQQRQRFLLALSVCKREFPAIISHLGATYGAILGEEFAFDMLRVGLGLYGYLPIEDERLKIEFGLKKCMQVYAKGVGFRKYAFGGVGYGEGKARLGEQLSLLRFGYADGYLRDRKNGVENWQKNNWKTAGKDPVKNRELWEELYNLTQKHKVTFIKVKGHSDNEWNNRCDFLATSAIKNLE